MTFLVMLFVVVAAAALQSAVPGLAFLARAKAPLLLGVVLYYALTRERGTMLVAALLAGFAQDAMSPVPFGYSALCFCVAGLLAGRFRTEVFSESPFTAGIFGAAAAAGVTAGLGLLLWRDGLLADAPSLIALRACGAALLGGVFSPAVFLFARGLDRMVGNVPARPEFYADEEAHYI